MENTDVVCFGEVLWDQFGDTRSAGGAPLNVCYHLSKLGIRAHIVSQIGNDREGRDMVVELDRLGIDASHCPVSREWPTSKVEVSLMENNEVGYDILEDVAWDHIPLSQELVELVEGSRVLIYGSLAGRSPKTMKTLTGLLERANLNVFDVNLRPPFYTEELILGLMGHADILKLNEGELEQIGLWLNGESNDPESTIGSIQEAFPRIGEILLTCGARGAYHIEGGNWTRVLPHPVQVTDTVGSGDSFLAAFIGHRLKNASNQEALENAGRLSAFVAARTGACPEYDWEELESGQWKGQKNMKQKTERNE